MLLLRDDWFSNHVPLKNWNSMCLIASYSSCRRFGLDKNDCARYISTLSLRNTQLGESCAAAHSVDCDETSKYRSIDGTCNNIENPSWGSAMTAYTRVLFSQYFDGKCRFLLWSRLPLFSSPPPLRFVNCISSRYGIVLITRPGLNCIPAIHVAALGK